MLFFSLDIAQGMGSNSIKGLISSLQMDNQLIPPEKTKEKEFQLIHSKHRETRSSSPLLLFLVPVLSRDLRLHLHSQLSKHFPSET